MSDGNAGRAETPIAGFFQRMRKHIWLASIVLPALVIVPGVAYVFHTPSSDDVVRAVKDAGFDPLVPPNRLRGPGALYVVEGNSYRKVCNVDPSMLDGKVQRSPTPDHTRTRLERGGFSFAGDLLASVNGKLSGDRLTSIEYKLTNVVITEIAMSDLFDIQNALLSDPSCFETVGRLIKANRQVCAGYAALSATTSYRVRTSATMTGNAEAKRPVLEMVKQAIEQQAGGEIRIHSADELAGDNLFYGIQLTQLCVTLDTATQPSVLPPPPPASKRTELIDRLAVR